jgi:hypothetical protein
MTLIKLVTISIIIFASCYRTGIRTYVADDLAGKGGLVVLHLLPTISQV